MARIIVVANQKGGVGKTTTVANLGAALARSGHRVTLVDTDPQASLTASFGLDPYSIRPTISEVLLHNHTSLEQMRSNLQSNLDLVPASPELVAADLRLQRSPDRLVRLRKAIGSQSDWFDYMLIDTPPALGLMTLSALAAGGELLIPVASDYLAMRGVRAVLESLWLMRKRLQAQTRLLGVVATFFDASSPYADAMVTEMGRVFAGKFLRTLIPRDEAVAVAPAVRKTVIDYRPESSAARAYLRLAQEVQDAGRRERTDG